MAEGKNSTTYDMTNIYKQRLHSPRDKAGNIYYITKDGTDNSGVKSKNWMMNPNTVCNSPTNIRRIWFTAKNIIVEYYAAPKRGLDAHGKEQRGKLVEVRNLGGIDFRDKAKELLRLKSLGDQAKKAVEQGYMHGVEISGNPLLSKGNYAFNNIEEIYFDWTALASKDVELLYAPTTGMNRLNIINTYLNGGRLNNDGAGGIRETDIPLNIFLGAVNGNVNRNYARLKRIVMISNLQDIIDPYIANNTFSQHVDTFDINNVAVESKSWLDREEIRQTLNSSNCDVWVSTIQGVETANRLNKKDLKGQNVKTYFITKPQTFLFDELVLDEKIRKYASKVEDMITAGANQEREKGKQEEEAKKAAEAEARAQKDAEILENGPQAGSIYELMENIKQLHGLDVAKKAFAAVAFGLSDDSIKIMLASMPTDVQKMYNTARKELKETLNK